MCRHFGITWDFFPTTPRRVQGQCVAVCPAPCPTISSCSTAGQFYDCTKPYGVMSGPGHPACGRPSGAGHVALPGIEVPLSTLWDHSIVGQGADWRNCSMRTVEQLKELCALVDLGHSFLEEDSTGSPGPNVFIEFVVFKGPCNLSNFGQYRHPQRSGGFGYSDTGHFTTQSLGGSAYGRPSVVHRCKAGAKDTHISDCHQNHIGHCPVSVSRTWPMLTGGWRFH